jgi:hypothetical protein
MEGKTNFTERAGIVEVQDFVGQVIQGRKVLNVEENRSSLNALGIGKGYLVWTAKYEEHGIRKEAGNCSGKPPEEFILCEFRCHFNGTVYEGEWIRFMAKRFGKEYVEAYKKHEEERIKQELERAKNDAEREKETLNQTVNQLTLIAGIE